ncbi:hypothetical protein LNP00_04330 [Fructobacillus sp. M158]|uniref:hypothetical protein n=1 Tax=Fructobacillus parabroussonetiae TaxID=2713174 RepID=UPI002009E061|nr:hypothetical protein [Fructobacillus parabroussonetiae]MCK8617589.1 hypothetical protein [Fructobacillus parabroussonetiae]
MTENERSDQNRQLAYLLSILLFLIFAGTKDYSLLLLFVLIRASHRFTLIYYFLKRLFGSFQYEVRHVEKWRDWEEKGRVHFAWFLDYAIIVSLLFSLFFRKYYDFLFSLVILGLILYQTRKERVDKP